LGVVALFVSGAAAQESLTKAKRADIIRLMEVTGSAQLGLQFGDAMVAAFRWRSSGRMSTNSFNSKFCGTPLGRKVTQAIEDRLSIRFGEEGIK
jgi:hypothetical protein